MLEAGVEPPTVTKLANWSEPGPATGMQNSLTALGHGDLAWAGYFDNVRGRLGFYDGTLDTGKVEGPIAYLVCGWYADPTADPLGSAKVTSLTAFNAAMQGLGWQLDAGDLAEVTVKRRAYLDIVRQVGLEVAMSDVNAEYVTTGNWWPSALLFHGAVVGIAWPGSSDTEEVGGPPDAGSVVVAAGNTMAEALGMLIARANDAAEQAPVVEALQLGALAELDQPDGRALLDVQLHTTSFASMPGEPLPTEPVTIAPSGATPTAPANPATPGPGVFASQLAAAGPGSVLAHSPVDHPVLSGITPPARRVNWWCLTADPCSRARSSSSSEVWQRSPARWASLRYFCLAIRAATTMRCGQRRGTSHPRIRSCWCKAGSALYPRHRCAD